MNTLPVHVICVSDTSPLPFSSCLLIHMGLPKPTSHLAPCHTTLHWDFCQLRKNKHDLNNQRDFKAILSRACTLEAHRIIQKLEKRHNSTASAFCYQHRVALYKCSSVLPNLIEISQMIGCPSVFLGRLFEKPRFPLRGTWGGDLPSDFSPLWCEDSLGAASCNQVSHDKTISSAPCTHSPLSQRLS